ncbi:chitinase 18-4 [Pyrenophora seminiperda CCB06]|uniref:chitinase n=1 Tax=Pyrenophora seminiperda CCB06 TaxID=1302712 RepID=A0A3M7MDD6_9PLEO|nr:chitinase 18-4 [Pyrenophora seminiperda CCB06]
MDGRGEGSSFTNNLIASWSMWLPGVARAIPHQPATSFQHEQPYTNTEARTLHIMVVLFLLFVEVALALTATAQSMCVMYLTGQHNVVPELPLVSSVTHVELAFMPSSVFNEPEPSNWPLFTTVETVRSQFTPETAVMVAIGGWGDTSSFSEAAKTPAARKRFARNIAAMIEDTGADGVDIDWEYPGGNGEDYKQVPNAEKAWEIEAYPKLMEEIRAAIGPSKLISAAVPGLPRDMMAFTNDTVPLLNKYVDFFNIMTYDLLNRRDNVTKHHTGITLSLEAVDAYISRGVPPSKANLGFAFYTKWVKTVPNSNCDVEPVGCKTDILEDPETGADMGKTGGFSWHDKVPEEVETSFSKALTKGMYDAEGGGYYYWDKEEDRWWTFDTPEAILIKFPAIVESRKLGGVFAWGLGEDANDFKHLRAFLEGFDGVSRRKMLVQEEERSEL